MGSMGTSLQYWNASENPVMPSSSNWAMQMNPRLMGQVYPGLWVGELTSIKEIRKGPPSPLLKSSCSTTVAISTNTTTATTTKWTIISLLKSEKLTHFIHSTLDAIQKEAVEAAQHDHETKQQRQHDHQQQNDDLDSIASTHHIVIQRHVRWEIADTSESDFLSPRLEEILTIVEAALGDNNKEASSSCCLVHCAVGISRSVALCAAYLLWKRHDETLEAALARIRAVRPQAAPNLGFIASLRALEQCHGNVAAARQRMASKK